MECDALFAKVCQALELLGYDIWQAIEMSPRKIVRILHDAGFNYLAGKYLAETTFYFIDQVSKGNATA